jgi:hypothetical protein
MWLAFVCMLGHPLLVIYNPNGISKIEKSIVLNNSQSPLMTHNRLAESHADAIESDDEGLTFTVTTLKVRTIDPPVLVNGVLVLLSEIDPDYAAQRADYLAEKKGDLVLRVQRDS